MIISNLSTILGKKKLKIANVVKETNITRPTLTALYYNHSKGINFDTLNSLCQYLKVTPKELFTFYDIDVESIDVNYSSITEDEITLNEYGDTKSIISSADFDCVIRFKQIHLKPLEITGFLSSQTGDSYSCGYLIKMKRDEYLNLLPDEVENIIVEQLFDTLIEKFPSDDIEYISSLTISFEDTTFKV